MVNFVFNEWRNGNYCRRSVNAYIGFLGGSDIDSQIFFAKHLIAASVMSAPAAIVASKILIPETKEINQGLEINNEDLGTNVLEAISTNQQGISLAVNVGAMLLVLLLL